MRPVLVYVSQDQSNVVHSKSKPNFLPTTSSTRAAAGTTSLPMPSPGMSAILWRMGGTSRRAYNATKIFSHSRPLGCSDRDHHAAADRRPPVPAAGLAGPRPGAEVGRHAESPAARGLAAGLRRPREPDHLHAVAGPAVLQQPGPVRSGQAGART